MNPQAHRSRDRGFALLIVLWTIVLLSLVFTQLVAAGRGEAELAANLRDGATAEAAADAALYQAIFHLLDPTPARWIADGATHNLQLAGARAAVSVIDLSGRVNPNVASEQLLAALMKELETDQSTANAVAAAMVEWRAPDAQGRYGAPSYAAAGLEYLPAGSAFQSLSEIGLVVGMTAPLLARLVPHLSLANPTNPSPAFADPIVLRAMKDIDMNTHAAATPDAVRNVLITATVVGQTGARFIRRSSVRLGADAAPFETLSWESVAWQ